MTNDNSSPSLGNHEFTLFQRMNSALRLALHPATTPEESLAAILAVRRLCEGAGLATSDLVCVPPKGPFLEKMPFGKYCGKAILEIATKDPDYLLWLLSDGPCRKRPALA